MRLISIDQLTSAFNVDRRTIMANLKQFIKPGPNKYYIDFDANKVLKYLGLEKISDLGEVFCDIKQAVEITEYSRETIINRCYDEKNPLKYVRLNNNKGSEYYFKESDLISLKRRKTAKSVKAPRNPNGHDKIFNLLLDNNYLSEREKKILSDVFIKNKSLEEIGQEFGATRQYIWQEKNKAARKVIQEITSARHIKKREREHLQIIKKLEEQLTKIKADYVPVKKEEYLWKKIKIEELELPNRTLNCLTQAGIKTLFDLSKYSKRDLLKIKNFGRGSFNDLIAIISPYGVIIQ